MNVESPQGFMHFTPNKVIAIGGERFGGLGRPLAGHPHLRPSAGQPPHSPLHPAAGTAGAQSAQGTPHVSSEHHRPPRLHQVLRDGQELQAVLGR